MHLCFWSKEYIFIASINRLATLRELIQLNDFLKKIEPSEVIVIYIEMVL